MDLDIGASANGASGVEQLLEIETEAIGFHAIAGDAKVQLMQPWPTDNLPPPTSSLLAVASKRGLLAAGGPTSVVVASTEAAREAFKAGGNNNFKQFTPQLTLDLGIRVSQVAFSSDEKFLVISAEQGGGLAVYEVENLLKGNTQTSLELSTGGAPVRALIPNPDVSPEVFAVVTANGDLHLANLNEQRLSNSIRNAVSCVAWSNKGKQLVAGLLDGSASQMKATGEVVQAIPKPPGLDGNQYVSTISWLENDVFLVVHNSTDASSTSSSFHIISRNQSAVCQFQKLPDTCGPWGMVDRVPPHHFTQRLRQFPPDLQDVIFFASTVSDEIGLYTRSKKSLATNVANPTSVTGVFTGTTMAEDGRRAAVPMTDESTTSSPIGMALDLSSKTLVHKPLPAEEMDESPTPLPALLVLNNMGVLAGWWFTYAESIRTGIAYPGLANVAPAQPPSQPSTSAFGVSSGPTQLAFGQSAFGSSTIKPATSGFGTTSFSGGGPSGSIFGQGSSVNTSQPAFGSTSISTPKPAFGASSSLGSGGPAFGSTSMMGGGAAKPSAWGSAASKPTFGNASAVGSSFSAWATPGSGTANATSAGPVFGQASMSQKSIFGSPSTSVAESNNNATSSSGFASFSNTGGFGSLSKGPSVLGPQTASNAFGSSTGSSTFGAPSSSTESKFGTNNNTSSIFGTKPEESGKGAVFGSGFNVGTSWTNKDASKSENKPQEAKGPSMFSNDFSKILSEEPQKPVVAESEERDMSDEMTDTVEKVVTPTAAVNTRESTTPAETPAPSKFFSAPPTGSGLFGTQAQQKTTPAVVSSSKPTPSLFSIPKIKEASEPDLPLPPDTTSKATFTPTTSSATSTDSQSKATPESAPLPPDFVKASTKVAPSNLSDVAKSTPFATQLKKDKSDPEANIQTSKSPSSTKVDAITSNKSLLSSNAAPQSIFSKPQSVTPKPSTAQPKLFFPSEPDENEFETTDEEVYDSEDDEENGHEGDEGSDGQDEAEEGEEGEEEEEEEEGSGVDVGEEITTSTGPKLSANSSFGRQASNLTDGSWSNVKTPQQQASQSRKNLFGAVNFPPKQPENERSPSPERRAPAELMRSEGSRSVSTPNMMVKQKINLPSTMKQTPKPAVSFEQRRKEEQTRLASKAAQQKAQEEQPLEDDEDDAIKRLLASPIEPNTELESFIAHQDYAAVVSKAGVPGQIEKIYRDINSMIDTIGLNCRNIQAFTAGHEEGFKDGRGYEDLDEPKNWTLVEVQDLKILQQDLRSDLEISRIGNVQDQTQTIRRLQEDITKLSVHQRDVRGIIETQLEAAANADQYRDLELSASQQEQRSTLRAKIKAFQAALMETESAIAMLRAKLATASTSSSSSQQNSQKVPTMEAVGNTVRKMTQKIEEKSGDIDVLEARLRKLGIQPQSPSGSRNGSRENSPYSASSLTSKNPRSSLLLSSSIQGGSPLRNTWRASGNRNENGLGESVGSSSGLLSANGSSLGYGHGRQEKAKKVAEYTEEDIAPFVRRAQRKKILMGLLRDGLVGRDGEKSVSVIGVE